MASGSGSADSLASDKPGLEVKHNDVLNSSTSHYLILNFMGEGFFGKVARCKNLLTAEEVALKILKSEKKAVCDREINMLEVVSVLDPVKTNVVQLYEKFEHKGHTCLAFEMLDRSLFQLLADRCCKPLSLCEIRPIAQQLLTAFDALKGLGVIHSDLKADNIMLVNQENQPLRVKLIDFGVSLKTSEVTRGKVTQPLGYRAPEVTLGLPFSEAIDMWGLGCVLAFLYLGNHLFGVHCEYQMVMSMVEVLGQPADHLLSAGSYTRQYFKENQHWHYPKWWLKTPREYQQATGTVLETWRRSLGSLDEVVTLYPETQECTETEDCRAFVSFLKCLLQTDPEQRITPDRALNHPFVTMTHLEDEMDGSIYVDESFNKMLVCQIDNVDLIRKPDNKTQEESKVAGSSGTICSGTDAAAPRSSDGVSQLPDGAAAAGGADTTGSVEEEPAVSQSAASCGPAEESLATDRSPDAAAPVKIKKSRLRRIRKFFSRAIRTVFSMKQ